MGASRVNGRCLTPDWTALVRDWAGMDSSARKQEPWQRWEAAIETRWVQRTDVYGPRTVATEENSNGENPGQKDGLAGQVSGALVQVRYTRELVEMEMMASRCIASCSQTDPAGLQPTFLRVTYVDPASD